jgi:hypothetical protein
LNTHYQDHLSKYTVFEGWDMNQDEIVRREDLVNEKELERKIENAMSELLSFMEYDGMRVSRAYSKAGYVVNDVEFKVSVVDTYIPRTSKIEKALGELSKIFGKCHHLYMFLDPDLQPDIRIIGTEDCDDSESILCIRQDVTLYYLKIINKIKESYIKNTENNSQVIVLDFSGAHFDPVMLKKGIVSLLDKRGYDYPRLIGIVSVLPKHFDSGALGPFTYFFVANVHYNGTDKKVKQRLLEITKVQTSVSIMPSAILITRKSSGIFPVRNPCINMPSLNEIRKIVTPEMIYEQFSY